MRKPKCREESKERVQVRATMAAQIRSRDTQKLRGSVAGGKSKVVLRAGGGGRACRRWWRTRRKRVGWEV